MRYVRGDDFTEKHWMEVFSILGMLPKGVEELTLKDFLDVSDLIRDKSADLQVGSSHNISVQVVTVLSNRLSRKKLPVK